LFDFRIPFLLGIRNDYKHNGYNTVRYNRDMKSQHLLSNDQYQYITSQINDIPNKSENLKRVAEKIENAFKTFDIVYKSERLPQNYKDMLFDPERVNGFLQNFTYFDRTLPQADEANKQNISKIMIEQGLRYFQSRYKETKFLSKRINDLKELLNDLQLLTLDEVQDNQAMTMYRMRKKLKNPPHIDPIENYWTVLCIHCYNYSRGSDKTKESAIKKLRHEKYCMYKTEIKRFDGRHKQQIMDDYLKIIPPINKKK